MGTDSNRTSHNLDVKNNTFRDVRLDSILNDIDERFTGLGFLEVTRTGVFVTKLTVWDAPAKNKKRAECVFTKSGPFITQIVEEIFDETTGTIVKATATTTITRNGNNQITDVTTATARP